jgi:hypothetical protein
MVFTEQPPVSTESDAKAEALFKEARRRERRRRLGVALAVSVLVVGAGVGVFFAVGEPPGRAQVALFAHQPRPPRY